MTYTVEFTLIGKKFRTKIEAPSAAEAKRMAKEWARTNALTLLNENVEITSIKPESNTSAFNIFDIFKL